MATKGIWQLKKIVIQYCSRDGSSSKVRSFLESPWLKTFAVENPQLEIESVIRNGRHPVLISDYITKEQKVCDIKNQDHAFIQNMMNRMRNTSGRKMTKLNKPVKSSAQSIQGLWEDGIDTSMFKVIDKY